MHVHATQVNPYAAADALRSAQRTEAKREAERVRQELMESASELAGESEVNDDFVVQMEERGEPQKQAKKRTQHGEQNQINRESPSDDEESESHLSDWA
jgi:hypothetical protein